MNHDPYDLDDNGIVDEDDLDILASHVMNRKGYKEEYNLNDDDAVDILDVIKPIYNFKAGEEEK